MVCADRDLCMQPRGDGLKAVMYIVLATFFEVDGRARMSQQAGKLSPASRAHRFRRSRAGMGAEHHPAHRTTPR
jgi:hypothetical protein